MTEGFNTRELSKYEKELLSLATQQMKTQSKKFMRKEGTKLKNATVLRATAVIKPSKRNTSKKLKHKKYLNSIKRGEPYNYDGALCIRTYSYAPHAHLLEDGHRKVVNPGKGDGGGRGVKPGRGIGREVGFVPGLHIFSGTAEAFQDDFYNDCQSFIDDVLDKGLS